MMKKKMRVSMDPAPSCSFLVGEEAMARLKHQYLLEDYQGLLKESKEKRERLQKAIQRKFRLLAEVQFLTKKYQSLANNSQAFSCKSKKKSYKTLSPNQVTRPPCPVNKAELPLKEMNCRSKETSVQATRKLIDLNQASLPNDEEIDSFDVEWENLKMVKLRRSLIEDVMADDLKLSVCRDIGSGSNRSGKRKISWQDQLALRV
ncbi:hypothetical protein IEQ34_009586 [Dendrobium chrysotoxum]|uniref:Uncharacterized protein n=1 Tax=Dendrobium chrysotoxum TaxID=161865 RepID=A0AAV7GZ55_DENCH|nr:hypothetical protein IEQ34_009586 [Dendrobium chrysotoxum]